MSDLMNIGGQILATSEAGLERVKAIESKLLLMDQVEFETHHVLHAGTYARTVNVKAGVAFTNVFIKIPTTLIVCGHMLVTVDDCGVMEVNGYHVFAAAAGRKQAFVALSDTWLTMIFKTDAKTIDEAEAQFTDESHKLASKNGKNIVVITEV